MVLNELNNLKINQEPIPNSIKERILKDLFYSRSIRGKITIKKLQAYLINEGIIDKGDPIEISGIDLEFKSSLTSYNDMKAILGDRVNTEREMVEDIIVGIVLFGEDKRLLRKRLESKYVSAGMLTETELNEIVKKKYCGWGRLSKKFLSEIECINKNTGEIGRAHV